MMRLPVLIQSQQNYHSTNLPVAWIIQVIDSPRCTVSKLGCTAAKLAICILRVALEQHTFLNAGIPEWVIEVCRPSLALVGSAITHLPEGQSWKLDLLCWQPGWSHFSFGAWNMPSSLAVPRSNKAKLRPSETVRELTLAEEAFATLFAEPSKMKKIEEVPISS